MTDSLIEAMEQSLVDARNAALWAAIDGSLHKKVNYGKMVYWIVHHTGTAEVGKVHERIVELVQEGQLRYAGGYLSRPTPETEDVT